MTTELKLPFRDDWFLAVNLRAQGFNVILAVARADGAELTDADQRTIRAATVALAAADAEVYRRFAQDNAAGHAVGAKGAKAPKPRPRAKTRPKRAAAKRPGR